MEIMEYHKYSSVPVITKDGKYAGTITEGDLLWGLKGLDLLNLKEAETVPVTRIERRMDYRPVRADANIEDLIGRAMEQNFIPVVDDQGNFIGIITRKDIIGFCYEKIQEMAEKLSERKEA